MVGFERIACDHFTETQLKKHGMVVTSCMHVAHTPVTTTLDKKRTISEIRGEKNAVPSSDIMLDDARSAQGKSRTESRMTLPCADRSFSQDRTVFFSPQISGMVFFLSRVVVLCPRVHKNKSIRRLIFSLWGTGTAKFQVTWLLRIVQKSVSIWQWYLTMLRGRPVTQAYAKPKFYLSHFSFPFSSRKLAERVHNG